MAQKLLNLELTSVTAGAVIISLATAASKVAGLVRDRLFAHYFGVGPTMDAYYAAFKIPDSLYNLLIAGALTAGFIPVFSSLFYSGDDKRPAWQLARNVMTIATVAVGVLALVGAICTPQLATLIAPGFDESTRNLTILMTRIMFLSPILLSISMVLGGILQTLRQFIIYSLAPIGYNIGIIFGATVLAHTRLGAAGLAWGVVLGALMHMAIQTYGAYQAGFRWRFSFNIADHTTQRIWYLMIPRTLGLAISQINIFVVTMLASLLPAGSVAVFNYANNLQAIPTSLIGIPFAVALFPVLTESIAKYDRANFSRSLWASVRTVFFLTVPFATLVLLLRAQLVRVALGTGQFDWTATIATANALAFFSLGLIGAALVPTLARAFYALHDTKTPFTLGVIAELLSIIAALVLMRPLGAAGLALAFSIGSTLNAAFLLIAIYKYTGDATIEESAKSVLKVAVAALAMGSVVQYLKYPLANVFDQRYFWGIFSQGAVAAVAGSVVYGAAAYLLKIPEMLVVAEAIKRKWLKLRRLPTELDGNELQ